MEGICWSVFGMEKGQGGIRVLRENDISIGRRVFLKPWKVREENLSTKHYSLCVTTLYLVPLVLRSYCNLLRHITNGIMPVRCSI